MRRSQRRSDEKKRLERNTNQRDGEEVREETGAEKADDAKRCERCSPSVLVERKELQSLQSEWRALFSRIDEAAAEVRVPRALRGEVEFQ